MNTALSLLILSGAVVSAPFEKEVTYATAVDASELALQRYSCLLAQQLPGNAYDGKSGYRNPAYWYKAYSLQRGGAPWKTPDNNIEPAVNWTLTAKLCFACDYWQVIPPPEEVTLCLKVHSGDLYWITDARFSNDPLPDGGVSQDVVKDYSLWLVGQYGYNMVEKPSFPLSFAEVDGELVLVDRELPKQSTLETASISVIKDTGDPNEFRIEGTAKFDAYDEASAFKLHLHFVGSRTAIVKSMEVGRGDAFQSLRGQIVQRMSSDDMQRYADFRKAQEEEAAAEKSFWEEHFVWIVLIVLVFLLGRPRGGTSSKRDDTPRHPDPPCSYEPIPERREYWNSGP